jgi:glycosyltransferase involved in cell wall biosynthesis
MSTIPKQHPCIGHKLNRAKVLFIQPGYAHYRYSLFDLLNKNHDVTFVFIRNKTIYPSRLPPNPEWNMLFLNRENNPFWVLKLAKHIFTLKPQVIITAINGSYQTIASLIVGKILKIPVILWSLSWDTSRFRSSYSYWRNFQRDIRVKWSAKNANAIVVAGTKSREFNERISPRGKPIFTAYQSTEDHFLMTEVETHSTGRKTRSDKITILYLSRIVESKGLDVLIRAFSEIEKNHKHVTLVVAGNGPFRNYCEILAKHLMVKSISFYGDIPNEDAWNIYEKADIFVLPCSGRNGTEAWGLVINEAASMSLPVITTDAVGAVGDLVKDGINGYVVKAGVPAELRLAIEALINDKAKRERMGKKSRKLFESINSYKKMYDGFNNAIYSVITQQ